MKELSNFLRENLFPVLSPYGFIQSSNGLSFARYKNGLIQGVLLLPARSKKTDFSVMCTVIQNPDETESSVLKISKNLIAQLLSSKLTFFLTPIAPFQNNFDWHLANDSLANASISEINELLNTIAIPFFDYLTSPVIYESTLNDLPQSMKGRDLIKTIFSILPKNFEYSLNIEGGYIWRKNGDVFVILMPEFVGYGCFLFMNVILWTPLQEGISLAQCKEPPTDISTVSYKRVGPLGEFTDDGVSQLWLLPTEGAIAVAAQKIAAFMQGDYFTKWLCSHNTVAALLHNIDPQIRSYVTSNFPEGMQ